MSAKTLTVGDIVEAGEGDDFNRGVVLAIDASDEGVPHTAYVRWERNVSAPFPLRDLRIVGHR